MKKTFIKIIFVFIFICIALDLMLILSNYKANFNHNSNINQIANQNINEQKKLSEEQIVSIPNDVTINLSVIGDIMCHNTQYQDAYDASVNNYDFSYVFEDIKKYIEPSDLAIGNLETTLAGKEIGYSSYPTFNTPEHLATDLKELGIDVLSTANNHSLDKGFSGIENTINELDKVEILHTGTFKSEEDSLKPLIVEVKRYKNRFYIIYLWNKWDINS